MRWGDSRRLTICCETINFSRSTYHILAYRYKLDYQVHVGESHIEEIYRWYLDLLLVMGRTSCSWLTVLEAWLLCCSSSLSGSMGRTDVFVSSELVSGSFCLILKLTALFLDEAGLEAPSSVYCWPSCRGKEDLESDLSKGVSNTMVHS